MIVMGAPGARRDGHVVTAVSLSSISWTDAFQRVAHAAGETVWVQNTAGRGFATSTSDEVRRSSTETGPPGRGSPAATAQRDVGRRAASHSHQWVLEPLVGYRQFHDGTDEQVKYADGPAAEVEVTIDAPAQRVWELVSDINLPARFSKEFQGAVWLDDEPGLGARFVGRNAHSALGAWETTSWVNRYEPLREFGWAVSDPGNPSSTWWFALDEVGGRIRLRQGGRMGPAPSGLTLAITAMPDKEERIVARRLEEWERNMRATVDGIKAMAEADR